MRSYLVHLTLNIIFSVVLEGDVAEAVEIHRYSFGSTIAGGRITSHRIATQQHRGAAKPIEAIAISQGWDPISGAQIGATRPTRFAFPPPCF